VTCPCGSGLAFAECCERFHQGTAAPTAEALMRSRYSAFAVGDHDYLVRTWHPSTRPKRITLDPGQEWIRLQVLSSAGGFLDTEGVVEFTATWRLAGHSDVLHETSRFVRENGQWFYVAGIVR
jgi:SEC-C motif-containing protein